MNEHELLLINQIKSLETYLLAVNFLNLHPEVSKFKLTKHILEVSSRVTLNHSQKIIIEKGWQLYFLSGISIPLERFTKLCKYSDNLGLGLPHYLVMSGNLE